MLLVVAGSAIASAALWSCMSTSGHSEQDQQTAAVAAPSPSAIPAAPQTPAEPVIEQKVETPPPPVVEPPAPQAQPAPQPLRVAIAREKGKFPAEIDCNGMRLSLQGAGMCEWGFLGIDLYDCAFYVEKKVATVGDALRADQAMVIHLHFVRSLTKDQLCSAWRGSVEVNQKGEPHDYAASLQQLCDAMRDVGDGDQFSFYLQPGKGMRALHNGTECAHIDDEAFRRLFVKLYLGPNPPTKSLRKAMLGGAK
jgi:hypothetical protein